MSTIPTRRFAAPWPIHNVARPVFAHPRQGNHGAQALPGESLASTEVPGSSPPQIDGDPIIDIRQWVLLAKWPAASRRTLYALLRACPKEQRAQMAKILNRMLPLAGGPKTNAMLQRFLAIQNVDALWYDGKRVIRYKWSSFCDDCKGIDFGVDKRHRAAAMYHAMELASYNPWYLFGYCRFLPHVSYRRLSFLWEADSRGQTLVDYVKAMSAQEMLARTSEMIALAPLHRYLFDEILPLFMHPARDARDREVIRWALDERVRVKMSPDDERGQVLRAIAAAPNYTHAAALIGDPNTPTDVLQLVQDYFVILQHGPSLVRRTRSTDIEGMRFWAGLSPEDLAYLDQFAAGSSHWSDALRSCTPAVLQAFVDATRRLGGNWDEVAELALTKVRLTPDVEPTCRLFDLEGLAWGLDAIIFDALTNVLRLLPTDAHRRMWMYNRNGRFARPIWKHANNSEQIDLLRAAQQESSTELARTLRSFYVPDEPRTQRAEIDNARALAELVSVARVRVAHDAQTRRADVASSAVAPSLRERWQDNENVMRDPRREAVNASLFTLLAAHPLSTLSDDATFTGAQGGPRAERVVAYVRGEHTMTMPGGGTGNALYLADVLRLVLRGINTYEHASGDATRTRVDRANMRQALANNLASGVENHDVVCHIGLCERMVRALSGYLDDVHIAFVTPRELVNNLAGELQRNRVEPLDNAALKAFVDRCVHTARDYFDAEEKIAETASLARQASDYLRDSLS